MSHQEPTFVDLLLAVTAASIAWLLFAAIVTPLSFLSCGVNMAANWLMQQSKKLQA